VLSKCVETLRPDGRASIRLTLGWEAEAQAEIIREIASRLIEGGVTWPAGQGTCPICRALMLDQPAGELSGGGAGQACVLTTAPSFWFGLGTWLPLQLPGQPR
jgi:hypothetical protein